MYQKGTTYLRILTGCILLPLSAVLLFQNCSGFSAFTGGSDSGPTAQEMASNQCQFVGPQILQSRLINILNISSGDVPVLDSNGNSTGQGMIATNETNLGEGNPSAGIPDNYACSAGKFKTAMMVMIDACSMAMTNPATVSSLFPKGVDDYTNLYQVFIGRAPTSAEVSTISNAVSGMDSSDAATAACAIVSSSLEALIVI